jgi:hypothetical protein
MQSVALAFFAPRNAIIKRERQTGEADHHLQPLPKWPPAWWQAVLIAYGVVVRVYVYLRKGQPKEEML